MVTLPVVELQEAFKLIDKRRHINIRKKFTNSFLSVVGSFYEGSP